MLKKMLLSSITILMLLGAGFSQTVVEPGDGTLGAAIKAAASGDVLVLKDGGLYTESTDSFYVIDKRITIKAEAGASVRPILKMLTVPAGGLGRPDFFYMMNNGAISMHFLELDGIEPDTTTHRSVDCVMEVDTTPNTFIPAIKYYDCLVHSTTNDLFDGNGDEFAGQNIKVDTLIAENTFFYHVSGFGFKAVALGYVKFENCTGWDVQNRFIRFLDCDPDVFVNHCTFYSVGMDGNRMLEFRNKNSTVEVKNCIFVKGNPGEQVMRIDGSTGNVANCSFMDVGALNIKVPFADTLMVDPKFTDPDNGDFTLAADSPVIGKADDGKALGDLRWDPTISSVLAPDQGMPSAFALSQNYPNPFNPSTNISFTLARKVHTRLTVLNLLGQVVATLVDREMAAGQHVVTFNGTELNSGVYFYKLDTAEFVQMHKMMLVK